MPGREELPDTLRRSSAKAQRTWIKAHDAAVEQYGEGERAHRTAFAPPPSVDTAVLRFERRGSPLVPVDAHRAYLRFLNAAFASSEPIRRNLRGSVSPLELKRLAASLGFAPDARARELDATQWARVFAFARTTKGRSRGPQSLYGS